MSRSRRTIQARHPDKSKSLPRISEEKYEAIRRALLRSIPRSRTGIPFKGLAKRVSEQLPRDVKASIGSVSWYTTVVKLDLEARGEIERVPDVRPQRLRRKR